MWDACVLDSNLQEQLVPYMKKMKPRPSIYCPDFIAANQSDRADNVLKGDYYIFISTTLMPTDKLLSI